MKLPSECISIEEVRGEIDRIDEHIIKLLAERFLYVKEVIKYKNKDEDAIFAKPRYDSVMEQRREWAIENQLNADVIEDVFKKIVGYFIDEQLKMANLKQ